MHASLFQQVIQRNLWSITTAVSNSIPPNQSSRTSEEQPDSHCRSRPFCGIRQPASFLPCIQKRRWRSPQRVSKSALFPHRKIICCFREHLLWNAPCQEVAFKVAVCLHTFIFICADVKRPNGWLVWNLWIFISGRTGANRPRKWFSRPWKPSDTQKMDKCTLCIDVRHFSTV